jgi:N-methylhydantoinase A/oxoprolinase/acetone carboxylase beta subunit
VFMDEGLIVERGDRTLIDACLNPRLQRFVAAVL